MYTMTDNHREIPAQVRAVAHRSRITTTDVEMLLGVFGERRLDTRGKADSRSAGTLLGIAVDLQFGCPITDRPEAGNLNFDQIAVLERVLD